MFGRAAPHPPGRGGALLKTDVAFAVLGIAAAKYNANTSSTHLREHGQLFGKVDHACDGGGDDLGELAEGLQVHLVPIRGGRHRGLANLLRLETEEDG